MEELWWKVGDCVHVSTWVWLCDGVGGRVEEREMVPDEGVVEGDGV